MPKFKIKKPDLVIRTAGLGTTVFGDETMRFTPGRRMCGDIEDGVVFDIGRGGWVIRFDDLIRMAEAAKAARAVKEGKDD
jgi:hypothetical protein